MAVVQCKNKHFYDASKYKECPHCKRNAIKGTSDSFEENKTVAKYSDSKTADSNPLFFKSLRNSIENSSDDCQKTVAKYFADRNINPIAGWLVCTKGENKGRSFEIHIGKNFIGRSMKMDIHTNDERISRDNHFSIVYDPKSTEFYVVQGNGLTYYNGEILTDAQLLIENDEISAGSSIYVFVPFCKKGRYWNE